MKIMKPIEITKEQLNEFMETISTGEEITFIGEFEKDEDDIIIIHYLEELEEI